jgi:hypothetical protein
MQHQILYSRLAPALVLLLLALLLLAQPAPPATRAAPGLAEPGLFGLNMYITGRERKEREARKLLQMANAIDVTWTREEISWASWGSDPRNDYYDERIGMIVDARIGIIGMLLTTPEQYRDPACVQHARATDQPAYWCAPTDPAAFATWAAQVVERYDGDGEDDAPGSPRIAVWQIWNEPDQDGTWLPRADPVAYGTMLRAAYRAIKEADPSATVLSGGVMTFDTIGVNGFMDRVVEVAGWNSFDVLALHPWLIDHAPDSPYLINPRERFDVTIPGRLALAQNWVNRHGGGKPIWITEVGWSTCGNRCEPQFAKSEDEQATYMVRTFVLAAAAGIEHVSYFQLEDKFQGDQIPWSQAAILHDDLRPKPAYFALGTLVDLLQFATYQGTGRFHQEGRFADHRFSLRDGGTVAVLWRLGGSDTIDFPLNAGQMATLIRRDGGSEPLSGPVARLTVDDRPLYIQQRPPQATRTFNETPYPLSGAFLAYWERSGGLERLGLPISEVRGEPGDDGNLYPTQWFERARLERHPQNAPPYDMQLGRLGVEVLQQRDIDWRDLPTVDGPPRPECRYFAATQHSLCPPFRAYWESNGGLAVFGYPISEPFIEENEADDWPYLVQYFERNRFEHHPANEPPYDVLLGRLGAELKPE